MRRVALIPTMTLSLLALALPATQAGAANPRVFPPQAHPHGQTYSEWAAAWWQWALSQPIATNPVLDETGANCAVGQTGHVWFLAGTFGGTATRSCTVPTGTALFFPVVNTVYCAFPDDPPEQRTEEFVRSQVAFVEELATDLTATIDGVSVPNIRERYFVESSLFSVVLPADNLFALPEGFVLGPCADAGYYLMTRPLPVGEHTIHFAGSVGDLTVDVTYEITVVPRGQSAVDEGADTTA